VAKDQVLLTLDDTQPRAQLEVLRGQYFAALAREARLVAQRDGQGRVVFAKELLEARNDPRAADAMRVQAQTFTVRKQAHDGEATLYERQIQQLRAKAAGLAAQKKSREQLMASFESERVDFEALLQQGYAERQRVREMERNIAQSEGQRGSLISELAATELQVSETQVKILQLGKELQREVAKELAEVQADLSAVREKLRSLQDMVERTVVRAPDAGMVLGLEVHTLGAVVRPGGRLLDIVPQNEKLVVEAQLSPQDIDQVRIGQMAEVRFPSFKARDLPRIDGRLISVSADRLMDEADGRKVPYYLARVEIPAEGLQALTNAKLVLLPGMPAEVLVTTGERTMLQYLVAPLSDTVARSFRQD
jgi:epimerase transport system membrane fusion protein